MGSMDWPPVATRTPPPGASNSGIHTVTAVVSLHFPAMNARVLTV